MFLVDTHVPLWFATGNPRLGSNARRLVARGAFVSSVTLVEWHIKAMLGRLHIPAGPEALVEPQGLTGLTFTSEHAAGFASFPELVRHDPFDRMLLAQAHVEGVAFLTADRSLLALGRSWIVDARQ